MVGRAWSFLIVANLAVATTAIALGAAPAVGDRAAYVVRPPWLSASDVTRRVAAAGGTTIAVRSRFVSALVVPEASMLSAFARNNPALILVAATGALCAAPRKRAP